MLNQATIRCIYATFILLQVYDASLSYFINGTSIGSSARGTRGLVSAVRDANGIIRLGQANNGVYYVIGLIMVCIMLSG